jgi:hypothetical protein
MAKITIDLDADQLEPIVVAVLKDALAFELKHRESEEIIDAYKIVIRDFMTPSQYQTFMHDIAKKELTLNVKRLVEADNGL